MVEYLKRMEWKTPFLRTLRSINIPWNMAIDSLECEYFDFNSCCQGGIQPRNSHRLGLIRDGRLVCQNRRAYERTQVEAVWEPENHREIILFIGKPMGRSIMISNYRRITFLTGG